MAPGGVRADEHDQVGLVEILVVPGTVSAPKARLVAGDRGGHAQPRIGVDVARAEEALHQLVGDVIVLGQKLAGDASEERRRGRRRSRTGRAGRCRRRARPASGALRARPATAKGARAVSAPSVKAEVYIVGGDRQAVGRGPGLDAAARRLVGGEDRVDVEKAEPVELLRRPSMPSGSSRLRPSI